MKHKQLLAQIAMILLAAVLITIGLVQVYSVYRHYRRDILANESRHLDSIVATSAGNLDWMLNGYGGQLEMLLNRPDFDDAEQAFLNGGDASALRRLMARRDVVRPDMRSRTTYSVAVWYGDLFLASSSFSYPAAAGSDTDLGELCRLRRDDPGRYWFVFVREKENGFRYELAVEVETLFSYQAENARVGSSGYFFLLDQDQQFIAYSNGQVCECASVDDVIAENGSISAEDMASMTAENWQEYHVFRFPWDGVTEETLVVVRPILGAGSSMIVGAAVSFAEFDSFLSDTLREVGWIILLEIAGALILCLIAARVIVKSRRNAMELAVVKERADLMEEINRQQQSLYHTERLQQLGVMTSGIVHEFNNMLTPMMGQSLLLLEQLADQDSSPEFDYALDIYESSEKAREVLKRMSLLGKKDVDMGYKTLDLAALLKKTMNLSSMAKDPHIQQELILPEEPIMVEGSEQLLTQAFLNLCLNACQAMGGEGTLTVSAERICQSGRQYALVQVSDTGPGIPEESLSRLYDPFFTTKGEKGTGLGLAICKKIIETHKGTIVAGNRESGGAVFTVQIPIADLPEE